MHERRLFRARIVASAAATAVSLAAGTNYVYSAWAPQFADRLKLSATDSNIIGLAGNLGMYTCGLPIGIFIDSRGPRPAVLFGAVLLALGYLGLHGAYESAFSSLVWLCMLSYLTGLGGCMSFMAAMKASALNWPYHRGTATGFPLAAFGLSAFFFSFVGSLSFPGDTGAFLELLAWGTSVITVAGFFLVRVVPASTPNEPRLFDESGPHTPLERPLESGTSTHDVFGTTQDVGLTRDVGVGGIVSLGCDEDEQRRGRGGGSSGENSGTISKGPPSPFSVSRGGRSGSILVSHELQSATTAWSCPSTHDLIVDEQRIETAAEDEARVGVNPDLLGAGHDAVQHAKAGIRPGANEIAGTYPDSRFPDTAPGGPLHPFRGPSSFRDRDEEAVASETSSLLSGAPLAGTAGLAQYIDRRDFPKVDIRGLQLLRHTEFWLLWIIMAMLAGVGLMTINNIGHNATALWRHYDPSIDDAFLTNRHQMHVSILSVGSFAGRLLSGLGSDFLIKVLHSSRLWCLVAGSIIFTLAQVCALTIENPHWLMLVSGLSGLGYGFVFGVLPSIVAEMFGVRGLSQNWGIMTLSPVVSGYIFNLFYGSVYDRQSTVEPGGGQTCLKGIECYRSAYVSTLVACLLGLSLTLWAIWHQLRHSSIAGVKPRD